MRVFYLDTSAVMKLLRKEKETPALVSWHTGLLHEPHRLVSSDLIRTELMLAGSRDRVDPLDVRRVVNSLSLLRVTSTLCESAGRVSGMGLRSLDTLHLASALSLVESLEAVVSYNKRMVEAAGVLGIAVMSPR